VVTTGRQLNLDSVARSGSVRLDRRIRSASNRVSLFYRVLIANVTIIALGAVVGTAVSTSLGRDAPQHAILPLIVLIAIIGITLSLIVNIVVLRAAFRPLTSLSRTAQAVRLGDRDARAPVDPAADPEMAQLAIALNATLDELKEDRNRLRDLASQVIRAQEDERRRVSRELHDDTAQILFAQLLKITALKNSEDDQITSIAGTLEESTVHAIEGVRRLALELRPPALDDLGLAEALAELCQRFEAQSRCLIRLILPANRQRLPSDVELVLYRIAQEALTNVTKHARACAVEVHLKRSGANVTLLIKDNGRGFDRRRFQASDGVGLGLGLFGMEERASLMGGTLKVRSSPTLGTEVFAHIPLAPARNDD
jgi:two-component system sensor histidine kinase UhpB